MVSDETKHVVFICYSSKDHTIAHDVCEKLEIAGIRCWIAPRDVTPTKPWGGEIVLAIKQSAVVLLIFTKHANESKDVRNEVVIASDLNRAILTYRHEEIVPCDDLVYYLRSLQWFDAFASLTESRFERLVSWFKRILATSVPGPVAAQAVEGLAELEKARAEKSAFDVPDATNPPIASEMIALETPANAVTPRSRIASNTEPADTTRATASTDDTRMTAGQSKIDTVRGGATPQEATAHPVIEPSAKTAPILANKIFRDNVRKKLAAYIGPVAEQVVDDAANQAHTESEFYEICSQDLSPKESERFFASVKGRSAH